MKSSEEGYTSEEQERIYPENIVIGGKMPIKKIGELEQKFFCRHPDHNVPTMIVLPPGHYEHTCPGCGETIKFSIYPTICLT